MANKIQIKRGLESNINKSNLLQGELAVTTDSNKLYVGTSKGPIQLNKDDESLVIIDYYETDESKKEKIKSLFLKEDGSISEHQLVKPSILLAPTIEPTDQTSTYTIGQYVCGFGDTESKIIEPTGKQITKYTLIFTSMAIDGGIYLTYNVSGDTLTYTWVKSPVIQSDYNQNDSTASDYIKNRPCYEDGLTTITLFSLSNPTLTTWQVLQSFESHSDQIDYMTNLFSLIPSLSLDGRKLDLNQTIPGTQLGDLSGINFPSDLYNAILDYSIVYSYQDTLNNFLIHIVLVPSTDTNNDAKLMYYVFTSGTIPDNVTIKNLAFTFTEKNIKMMEDKYLYSIVDTSDNLNSYVYDYQKKFTKRNNISDLTTQPTVTPKPSIVATDTGELYLVSFDWDNHGEPI
jgi:hypothetical protein